MNFVRSSETYESTDVSRTHGQYQTPTNIRQGFHQGSQRFGGPQHQHGSGQWQQQFVSSRYNGPQGLLGRAPFAGQFSSGQQGFSLHGFGNTQQQQQQDGFSGQQQGFIARQRYRGPQPRFGSPAETPRGQQSRFSGPRAFNGPAQRFSGPQGQGEGGPRQAAKQYSSFVKPEKEVDQFEGGSGAQPGLTVGQNNMNRPSSAAQGPQGPRFQQGGLVKREPVDTACKFATTFSRGQGSGPGRSVGMGSGSKDNAASVMAATAAAAQATREATKHDAKCVWLANQDAFLGKMKRLAMEIKTLKSQRPNSVDTIHSAANKALVKIQCEIESGPIVKGTGTFFCLVQFDGVNISVASALNKRTAKIEAFDIALAKLMKPFLRVVQIDGSDKELQAQDVEFSNEPLKQTVVKPTSAVIASISAEGSQYNPFQKESNVEAIFNMKKRNYAAKDISEFLLVEPEEHNSSVNGASILRRSADYSKMLLEYEFAAHGVAGAVRCIVRVEGNVLADIVASSKPAAKIKASQEAVDYLRKCCWTILTKQHHDTDAPEITKEEMFSDLASSFTGSSSNPASMNTAIPDGNLGKKLLQKMGWTGGGIGKDGTGIEEPVSMKQVINREGLGLSASRGITGDFRQRIVDMLESYAASERQDDLVFSPNFRRDERMIIHNECRRLNLKSNSKGAGGERFLIVRRKRSANQLLDHVMACGGETARYKIVPPGQRNYPWQRIPHVVGVGMPGPGSRSNTQSATGNSGCAGFGQKADNHLASGQSGLGLPGAASSHTFGSGLLGDAQALKPEPQTIPHTGTSLLGGTPAQNPAGENGSETVSGAGLLGPAPGPPGFQN